MYNTLNYNYLFYGLKLIYFIIKINKKGPKNIIKKKKIIINTKHKIL